MYLCQFSVIFLAFIDMNDWGNQNFKQSLWVIPIYVVDCEMST